VIQLASVVVVMWNKGEMDDVIDDEKDGYGDQREGTKG
jgi:hypothetical protein